MKNIQNAKNSMKGKANTIKIISLFFLVMLFSTNYYGGNSLFFLEDSAQFVLRVIFGSVGILLFIIYLAFKNKEQRELTEHNGYFYTKDVLRQMEDLGVSKESVELAICSGTKKEGRLSTFFRYGSHDTGGIVVVLDDKLIKEVIRIKGVEN